MAELFRINLKSLVRKSQAGATREGIDDWRNRITNSHLSIVVVLVLVSPQPGFSNVLKHPFGYIYIYTYTYTYMST